MLGASASLHPDEAGSSVRKVLKKSRPLDLLADDFTRVSIDPMKLKHIFGDIHSDRRIVHFGPSG